MKNFENSIDNKELGTPKNEEKSTHNLIPATSVNLRKSTFEMIGDSSQDYSSRVWNVVIADMHDHID